MAENAFTHSGDKFYISTTAQNADLTDHAGNGFPSLTYTEIKGVGSLGETGENTNIVNYDTWGSDVISKGKGMTNAGDPDLEMLRIQNDPGQIALIAAAGTKDNYALKQELQDGTVRYFRGLVTGPRNPGGRNEDFDLRVFTLALNQAPVEVAAS